MFGKVIVIDKYLIDDIIIFIRILIFGYPADNKYIFNYKYFLVIIMKNPLYA